MNEGNDAGHGRRRRRGSPRAGVPAVAAAGIALLAAACGGGGSSTTAGSTAHQQEVAYAQCMRSHGEPAFPDPDSNGDFITGGIDNRTAVYLRADNTCRHLLPNGGAGTAAQDQAAVRAALKFAQCMRAHGITNYPDPSVQSGGAAIGLGGTGVDPSAPQVKSASQACAPILHGGGS